MLRSAIANLGAGCLRANARCGRRRSAVGRKARLSWYFLWPLLVLSAKRFPSCRVRSLSSLPSVGMTKRLKKNAADVRPLTRTGTMGKNGGLLVGYNVCIYAYRRLRWLFGLGLAEVGVDAVFDELYLFFNLSI